MCNHKRTSGVILALALLASAASLAAENGITKEDIKRLQINAFTEEMQTDIEKSARSELQNSMKNKSVDIGNTVSVSAMEESSMPTEPTISTR